MHCRIIQTPTEWRALQAQWQALFDASQCQNPYLSATWLSAWIQHTQLKSLFILCVYQNDTLVAGLPLAINRPKQGLFRRLIRECHVIGTHPLVADETGYLIHPDNDPQEIYPELAQTIFQNAPLWDSLWLANCSDTGLLEALENQAVTHGYQTQTHSENLPLASLNADKLNWLEKDTQRIQKKLDTEGVVIEFTTPQSPSEKAAAFETLVKWHQSSWEKYSLFKRNEIQQTYQSLLNTPQAQLSVLYFNQQPVSIHYEWQVGTRYVGQLRAHHPHYKTSRPGILHLRELFRHLAQQKNLQSISFGRGESAQKTALSDKTTQLFTQKIYKKGWIDVFYNCDTTINCKLGKLWSH